MHKKQRWIRTKQIYGQSFVLQSMILLLSPLDGRCLLSETAAILFGRGL
jgi:hypothetical protein